MTNLDSHEISSLWWNYSKPSSNFILVNGTLLTGINNAINPPILITIDTKYRIDSGNTNEYHPKNSPNANKPKPTATEIAPLFLFSKYDNIVSMAPYANKMNETALKMCSNCTEEIRNIGKTPIDLKYLDFGKNDLMLWEKAMKKYPTVWIAIPKVWIHPCMLPDFIIKSSTINPTHMTQKPKLIEKNAIVNLNNVGLPVFLNPINDIIPITSPTKNPIKFSIFSNKNSNDV